ncbi:hypothetical protein EDE05_11870 [Neorhizobium sp. R1-B]|uniref:hypothetical protein n=1 Tax=Neorhizobium sp. R1-B TaxID=2485162 RepID=UPI00106643CF|nr:hypothetical protein [Neorhizobium sp. R1-B]TDX75616.1 hypothetical protein EDE05_11870 [Neorhizobium sp. R1-B]
MLLPTQQTYGLAATNVMQSMLESVEEQRRKEEAERTGKERDPIAEARISASEDAKRANEKIASALFGANRTDPNELKIELVDRLAGKLGIDTEEARSSYRLGKALEDALKSMMPDEVSELADYLGLDDLGITMDTLLAAIKNPYGDANARLVEGLTRKANGGKLDTEVERVVQRLENVADPKTLEELKLGPQGYDPTRVEDQEARAERAGDIEAAEAGKKLEDIQKVQDLIEEKNGKTAEELDSDGSQPATGTDDTTLLAVFAAAAEQIANSDVEDTGENSADAESTSTTEALKDEAPASEIAADAALEAISEKTLEISADILSIHIDDIGIYELLEKKLAA